MRFATRIHLPEVVLKRWSEQAQPYVTHAVEVPIIKRVDANCEELFRHIVEFSRGRFETDRATYHISARLDRVAPPTDVDNAAQLESLYLNEDDGRQILHVTFGSVLTDPRFGPAIHTLLAAEPQTHREVLAEHFGKHLQAIQQGM